MSDSDIEVATAPARWLLEVGRDGIPLTQTHAVTRAVVREAVVRWPSWNSVLFGPPWRECETPMLEALRDGLKRLRLMRRQGRRLLTTPRGRELTKDPGQLLALLAKDLGGWGPLRGRCLCDRGQCSSVV